MCAALIAGSVALPWYMDWVESVDPDTHVLTMRRTPLTGSGLVMSRQHTADVRLAPEGSMFFVGGIEVNVLSFDDAGFGDPGVYETAYYTAFLGPGVTILLAAGLAGVGVMAAMRRAGRPTLLVGLWIALVSWLAAGSTAIADSPDFELSGWGLQLWLTASVVAAGILGVAVAQTPPSHVRVGVSWIGVACVLAILPLTQVGSGFEEQVPFAAGAILAIFALELGVPATGAIIALESIRSRPHRRERRLPAALTLMVASLLWGWLLLAIGS